MRPSPYRSFRRRRTVAKAAAGAVTAAGLVAGVTTPALAATRVEAESATLGTPNCGDNGQRAYTLGTGETVVFNGGDGCTMTFTASGQATVERIRWFGGGESAPICGVFIVRQGGTEKARTAQSCSTGGASPPSWQAPAFPAHTLASGSYEIRWDPDSAWHDAHVDWIDVVMAGAPCGAPMASVGPASQSGYAPYNASFSLGATAASGCTIADHTFRFGDGSSFAASGGPPGSTYHRYDAGGTYTATLSVTQNDGKTASASATVIVTAAANDEFAAAIPVPGFPYSHTQSTTGFTTQPGEPTLPCVPTGRTAWYKVLVGTTHNVVADTIGGSTSFDTVLAVYSGASLTSLSRIACNDDTDGGTQSRVAFRAFAGTTYYVQVGGYEGGSGTYTLDVTGQVAPPPNDNFENAAVLGSLPALRPGDDTYNATSQVGERNACNGNSRSVWYRYTHPSTRPARQVFANTFGTSWNTSLSVWRGSSLTSLTAVTCNDDARGTSQSQVGWLAWPGTTYHVRLTGVGMSGGALRLQLLEGSILAIGDSVVAGHGIGHDPNGWPNNPSGAYVQLTGDALAMNVYNLARTGSCAGNNDLASSTDLRRFTPEACDERSIAADQLTQWASILPAVPTHVVIGVGGNDIEFAACIDGYMSWNGRSNDEDKAKLDLCKTPTLDERLSALDVNLQSILDQVKSWSSPAPYISVMGYYNPFPDAPTDINQACDMWGPAAIARNHSLAQYDHDGATFRSAMLAQQKDAYMFASAVVTSLNNKLQSVATANGATFVETASAFVGHDICRTLRDDVLTGGNGDPNQTWVYGPDWTDEFDTPTMWPRRWDSRRMPADCAYPNRGDEERYEDGSATWEDGWLWDYELWFRPNCLAHPTPSGHQQLANLVRPTLPLT